MVATAKAAGVGPVKLEYRTVRLSELVPVSHFDEKRNKNIFTGLDLDGLLEVTPRFKTSFLSRYQFSDNIFRYFGVEEVLERVSKTVASDSLRLCIERGREDAGQGFTGRLLAVSKPDGATMEYATADDVIRHYGGLDVNYVDGVITSTHSPAASGENAIAIAGDEHFCRYQLHTPIDGYGRANIYLSLLRTVCTNGAVGYARAFRSELNGGKDMLGTLVRALESFDAVDEYDGLHQRFNSAVTTFASLRDARRLYDLLARLSHSGELKVKGAFRTFHQLTGDYQREYGIPNFSTLTEKKLRTLKTNASLYQMFNFASELATHHAGPAGSKMLQAYIGSTVSTEYDLEGSAVDVPVSNRAFYLDQGLEDAPEDLKFVQEVDALGDHELVTV